MPRVSLTPVPRVTAPRRSGRINPKYRGNRWGIGSLCVKLGREAVRPRDGQTNTGVFLLRDGCRFALLVLLRNAELILVALVGLVSSSGIQS